MKNKNEQLNLNLQNNKEEEKMPQTPEPQPKILESIAVSKVNEDGTGECQVTIQYGNGMAKTITVQVLVYNKKKMCRILGINNPHNVYPEPFLKKLKQGVIAALRLKALAEFQDLHWCEECGSFNCYHYPGRRRR